MLGGITNEQICGIAYQDLNLVRVQAGLDGLRAEKGELVLNRHASGRADQMNTAHFTINAIVQNHTLGTQFDDSFVAIIAPLQRAISEGGNIPSGLSPGDSWFHADAQGDIRLPGAVIWAPDGMEIPAGLEDNVQRYPQGTSAAETRSNRDKAIAESFTASGAPLKQLQGSEGVASLYWSDPSSNEQISGFKAFADMALPGHEFTSGLHAHGEDGTWERMMASLKNMMQGYKDGERLYAERDRDVDLFKSITDSLDAGKDFIRDRIGTNAAPHAVAFYTRQLQQVTDAVNSELVPVAKREMEESGRYILPENALYIKNVEEMAAAEPTRSFRDRSRNLPAHIM